MFGDQLHSIPTPPQSPVDLVSLPDIDLSPVDMVLSQDTDTMLDPSNMGLQSAFELECINRITKWIDLPARHMSPSQAQQVSLLTQPTWCYPPVGTFILSTGSDFIFKPQGTEPLNLTVPAGFQSPPVYLPRCQHQSFGECACAEGDGDESGKVLQSCNHACFSWPQR